MILALGVSGSGVVRLRVRAIGSGKGGMSRIFSMSLRVFVCSAIVYDMTTIMERCPRDNGSITRSRLSNPGKMLADDRTLLTR